MTRYTILTLVTFCAVLLFPAAVSLAQERIEYGQVIHDTLTETDSEFRYGFIGNADDVVLIELTADELFGKLNSPILILTDSQGNEIANTTGNFSFKEAQLVTQLPSMQSYVLIVTREGGATGESLGAFTLKLKLLDTLTLDEPISISLKSSDPTGYYVVAVDEPFDLYYRKTGGDFAPQITLYALAEQGQLNLMAALYGPSLTTGMLGTFADQQIYILTIGEGFEDFHFDDISATLQIRLQSAP